MSVERPGIGDARRGVVFLLILLLAGCNPWNWREIRAADGSWTAALPDRPRLESRDIDAAGTRLRLSMSSTGVGGTLFAVGEAELPPALAADPQARERLLVWLSAQLLSNVAATDATSAAVTLLLPPGRELLLGRAVQAQARLGPQHRAGRLFARWFIVDRHLYQLVVLGADGELPPDVVDNFFLSFRLSPP